jgi:hypothetical protein
MWQLLLKTIILIYFCYHKCGGQGETTVTVAAYLHAVTNVPIHSVTHKHLTVGHTHSDSDSSGCLVEENIKVPLKSGPVCSVTAGCNC